MIYRVIAVSLFFLLTMSILTPSAYANCGSSSAPGRMACNLTETFSEKARRADVVNYNQAARASQDAARENARRSAQILDTQKRQNHDAVQRLSQERQAQQRRAARQASEQRAQQEATRAQQTAAINQRSNAATVADTTQLRSANTQSLPQQQRLELGAAIRRTDEQAASNRAFQERQAANARWQEQQRIDRNRFEVSTRPPNAACTQAGQCGLNLASSKKTNHILNGDSTGGGHLAGTGKAGKSEFPQNWTPDDVMNNASDIATMPKPSGGRVIQADGRFRSTHNVNGVDQVVVDDGADLVTSFPRNLPRNPK